jgi:hypothetical protein
VKPGRRPALKQFLVQPCLAEEFDQLLRRLLPDDVVVHLAQAATEFALAAVHGRRERKARIVRPFADRL